MTVTETSPAGPLDRIGSLLGPPSGRWGQRLATATAAYTLANQAYQWGKGRVSRNGYTVSVDDTDVIYHDVQAWVLERMPAAKQRALIAETYRRDHVVSESPGGGRRSGRVLHLHYDGSRSQDVTIDGHTVNVAVEREATTADPGGGSWRFLQPAKIVFAAKTLPARDAVLAFLGQVAADLDKARGNPRLFTATRWSEWRCNREMMPRPLDSVVLRAGQLEEICADLARFYDYEERYVRFGTPWHRGYLLHGPPGTGKTSTARALAAHHGLDLYYVPLSDLSKDTDLNQLVAAVDHRAVLLLEDVDVVHASRERDDTAAGITTSGLLNALDGVITPHGLVTVMTTNNLDALDPALRRPGRADRIEYMGHLGEEQFCRLVWTLTGEMIPDAPLDLEQCCLTAADVVEVVKRHLDDPAAAVPALRTLMHRDRVLQTT